MAEIAILRRVREEQERQQRTRNRRRPKKTTALLLGGVTIGGYFMYNGINQFLNRNLTDSASKGVPLREGAVTALGAMLVLGGLSLLRGMARSSAKSILSRRGADARPVGIQPRQTAGGGARRHHGFWPRR